MLSPALSKYILDEHPWSDSTEFRGIGRDSSDWIVSSNATNEQSACDSMDKIRSSNQGIFLSV